MQPLPKTLDREPLVDALFEVRLVEISAIADILPGFLFGDFGPSTKIGRLPVAELPRDLRANDPNLQFAPIVRIELDHYIISVGDRSVLINCKLPYPKWVKFKEFILDILRRIATIGIAVKVERYSLKFVNLIQAPTLAEQVSKINMSISLGDVTVKNNHANIQVHYNENDIVHILSAIIGAQSRLADGRLVFGAVVDVDSIRNVDAMDFATFANGFEPGLEELRQANKRKFFGCLTQKTIDEMGPQYV